MLRLRLRHPRASWRALLPCLALVAAAVHAADAPAPAAGVAAPPAPIAAAEGAAAPAAETPTARAGEDERADTAIEEIVVTAQKHRQSTQDVGISIREIGGDQLQAMHIVQPLDLAKVAPGLTTVNATSDGTPLFLVRGVGLDDFNANNSSAVGTYIDEVFASFPEFLAGQLYDVDHVEVLEGPQGTLYGKNTEGGAISIFSRKPTPDFEGYADLSYGRWNTVEAQAAVSGPLAQGLNARLSGTLTRQGEGYQTDIDTGERYGRLERGGLRALFDLRLSAQASVLFNLHYAYDHSTPSSPSTTQIEGLVPGNLGFATAGLLDSPAGGTQVRVGGLHLYKDEHSQGESATYTLRGEGYNLTSITAFDNLQSRSLDNYDGYPAADDNWAKNFAQQQWSEELRLNSTGPQRTDWVVGADLSGSRFSGRDSIDQTFVYGYATAITGSGAAVTQENLNQSQKSLGLFAHTETHLDARWTLVGGLRWSEDRTGFDGVSLDRTGLVSYGIAGYAGPIVPGTPLAALDEAHTEGNLSYKLGLEMKATDKVMLYTSIATSYKAGIFYGQPAQLQGDWGYVRPEHVQSLELGIKSRFFGDSLQFNAALFHSDYRDRQSLLAVWGGPVGALPVVAAVGNVPRARIDGVEEELTWHPVKGLELQSGATYLDGRVTESIEQIRGLAIYNTFGSGSRLPLTPTWSANALARYEHAAWQDDRAYGQLRYSWAASTHPELGDPAQFGPVQTLDLRLGLRSTSHGWDASVWASNLLDNRNATYAFSGSFGQPVTYYQKPRSGGVDLRYEF
jgi:iron complex outermembrane receptor protein